MRIIVDQILPNSLAPVIAYAASLAGAIVVFGAGISFIGLGIQPPEADWGRMINDGREVLDLHPACLDPAGARDLRARRRLQFPRRRAARPPRSAHAPLAGSLAMLQTSAPTEPADLLRVEGLKTYFFTRHGWRSPSTASTSSSARVSISA